MFPYNPTTQDTSGQIQSEYNIKSSDRLNAGINQASKNITDAAMGAMGKGMMDRATLDMNLGKMDQYKQAGIMDEATYSKFVGMGVQKQSGALAGFDATIVKPYLQQQQYQSQMQARQMYGQGQQQAAGMENFSY